jgi:hypothetical protein
MRVRLIVFKQDIETRLVFLDQIGLENESFDLVIDDDELEIRDGFDQSPGLGVLVSARLKILPHAIAEVLGLADIQDLPISILVQVDARSDGKGFEFVLQVGHFRNLSLRNI